MYFIALCSFLLSLTISTFSVSFTLIQWPTPHGKNFLLTIGLHDLYIFLKWELLIAFWIKRLIFQLPLFVRCWIPEYRRYSIHPIQLYHHGVYIHPYIVYLCLKVLMPIPIQNVLPYYTINSDTTTKPFLIPNHRESSGSKRCIGKPTGTAFIFMTN